jgi:cysteine desulfurase
VNPPLQRVFLDHHSTTPCDPRVVAAMLPWFHERPGNAASPHLFGWEAKQAVEDAQQHIATLVNCRPSEIVFTSGATESNNLALQGLMRAEAGKQRHLVISSLEHPSVLQTAHALAAEGFELSVVPPRQGGIVDPADLQAAFRDDTLMCSVHWAHNEIGCVQPIEAIGRLCRARNIRFHSDATQAVGRIPVDARHADLLSFSAHKMYGPKGIGALVVRRVSPRIRLRPLFHGGGQQHGHRSGTLPVSLVVGFGAACRLASELQREEGVRILRLRERLHERLRAGLDGVLLNGEAERRLPGNLNLSFLGVEAQALLLQLPGVALSVGSACHTDDGLPSPALLALGRSPEEAHAAIRFGIGRENTEAEIDGVADAVIAVVRKMREQTPVHAANRARYSEEPI